MRALVVILAVLVLLPGCQVSRDLKLVIANARRIPRSVLEGEFLFLKSVTRVTSAGPTRRTLVPGMYLENDRVVRFVQRENHVDIVSTEARYLPERGALENPVIGTIDARRVDLRQKPNVDGQPTHEQEETDTWRDWRQREYVILDFAKDSKDGYRDETSSADMPNGISVDVATGAINVDVNRQLNDGTSITERYSFLRYQRQRGAYVEREYPRELQLRFGFFKTVRYGRDRLDRVVVANRRELMNRWSLARPIVFRYTEGFPQRLKPAVNEAFAAWNQAMFDVTGRRDLVPEPLANAGEQLGDVRYNFIHYDDTPDSVHRLLAYAPRTVDPLTGQILKGDIVVFGSTISRTVHAETLWRDLFPSGPLRAPTEAVLSSSERLLREIFRPAGRLPNLGFRDPRLPGAPNSTLVSLIRTQFTPDQARAALLREAGSTLASHATVTPPGIAGLINAYLETGDNAALIEERIVKPLVSHEIGHPLGLRHNFMGSADSRHYALDGHSSSIMDYPFLHSRDEMLIGPYDVAALRQLYGDATAPSVADGGAPTPRLIGHVPYLFCTDPGPDDVLAPRNPLCEPFDAGNTLTAAVENHVARYRASYLFNNTRLDEVSFPVSDDDYLRRVAAELIPLRVIYDHSNAILAAFAGREYGRLWRLLRQRIEADPIPEPPPGMPPPADPDVHIEEVPDETRILVGPGRFEPRVNTVERRIHKRRLDDIVADARIAKVRAFRALADIVRAPSTPARPDLLAVDPTFNEPQRRGVLPDKLLALMLAGARTIDPIGDGEHTSPFWTMRYDVPAEHRRLASDLFSDLISNLGSVYHPTTHAFSGRIFRPYDGSLRELAAELLSRDIGQHRRGVDARRLLALSLSPVHAPTWRRRRDLQVTIERLSSQIALRRAQIAGAPLIGILAGMQGLGDGGMQAVGALAAGTLSAELARGNLATLLRQHGEADRERRNIDMDTRPEARQDEADLDLIDAFRPERISLVRRIREADPQDDATIGPLRTRLRDREVARNAIPVAFGVEAAGERFLRAPCQINGLPFVPGTCLLLRDNVNVFEIAFAAAGEQLTAVEARLAAARERRVPNPTVVRELEDEMEDYRSQREFLRQYLAGEMDFATHLMNHFQR